MIIFLKKIWHDFISGPQWRKGPPLFQIWKNGKKHKSIFVFLWYWSNTLLDLCLTRQARLLFLIWLALTSYSLTMLPDSMPALWLFMSAAATIDLLAKFVFRSRLKLTRTMPQRVKCAVPFHVQYQISSDGVMPCHALLPDAYMLCDSPADILPVQDNLSADIPSKSTVLHEIRYLAKRRGIIHCTRPVAETSYPFHMFKRSIRYGKAADLTVLPYSRIMPELITAFHQKAADDTETPAAGTNAASDSGDGQDFYACRDYHTGDQLKRIHWRRTAQRNKLTVREYEKEGIGKAAVLLLQTATHHRGRDILSFLRGLVMVKQKQDNCFEAAVSLCASTLLTLEENGIPAELFLSDNALSSGEAMDSLAVVQHGTDIRTAAKILFSGERLKQFTGIFLIVTEYDDQVAALRNRIIAAGFPRINILLVTDHGETADKRQVLPEDVSSYRTGDILPEELL